MIGITYHKDYNKYDLGVAHPLVGDKPKKTMQYLKEKSISSKLKIFAPEIATEEQLLRVHTQEYVNLVKKLSETGGFISSDTPAPKGIYKYANRAVGGTLLGGGKLFEKFNCMINPLGGFHHSSKNFSSGFCFFNDIAVTIEHIRQKHNLKRFLIIDLDVHHANGTQEIYFTDPTVLNISFHQDGRTLYPGTGDLNKIGRNEGKGFTVNLPLPPKTGSKGYLSAFNEIIPDLTSQFQPEFIIYQSGVDTHHSDPLADLILTYQTFYTLGKKIKQLSEQTCNKLLVPMGGGYNSQASVISYYNIVCGLLNQKNYIKEKDPFKTQRSDETKKRVDKLKKVLSNYWDL